MGLIGVVTAWKAGSNSSSLVVTIPREIVEKLQVTGQSKFSVSLEDDKIIYKPLPKGKT